MDGDFFVIQFFITWNKEFYVLILFEYLFLTLLFYFLNFSIFFSFLSEGRKIVFLFII